MFFSNVFRRFILLALCFFLSQICCAEHLIFAADLIRHGDRTPVDEIPASPHTWKEGLGELTAEGMQQEFELGVALRKRYIEQTHLLPAQYDVSTIAVRSTDFNRTLMSAESLLYGLYPLGSGPHLASQPALPQAFQPIPIHTVPIEHDRLLLAKPTKNIFSLASLYFSERHDLKDKLAPYQNKIKQWNIATGFDLNNYKDINKLSDALFIRERHHVPLPAGISSQDAADIMALGQWIWLQSFHHSPSFYPMGHAFLININSFIQQAAKSKTALKYLLFSGHDSSIASVMATLGVAPEAIPPYASHLNFAVYENNGAYKIKVSLNNKLLAIPGCANDGCTLSQFAAIANK